MYSAAKQKLLGSKSLIFLVRYKSQKLLKYKYKSKERESLENAMIKLGAMEFSVPIILTKDSFSGDQQLQHMPYNHQRLLAKFYYAGKSDIERAISYVPDAQNKWHTVGANERASIWHKCAEIIDSEDRFVINAATMMGEGKTFKQAELDTYRLVQSLHYQAEYLRQITKIKQKHKSSINIFPNFFINPLDGFVAAMTPFNSLCMSSNLAFAPALMGNVVIWKPSPYSILSNFFVFRAMMKAGLPTGIINFVPSNARLFLNVVAQSKHLAGISFGGSTKVFRSMWHTVCNRREIYKNIPILSGECGGNNFHFVDESADTETVIHATLRAAFEYSGQKYNSCTRLYLPQSMWKEFRDGIIAELDSMKIATPCDFTAFTSSVINEKAFDRIVALINYAKNNRHCKIVYGGDSCKTLGYFIEPTVCLLDDPEDRLLNELILGPILSVFTYERDCLDATLKYIAKASKHAYTGSIFAKNDFVICQALKALRMAAANIYINEKCTGATTGHPPFSGGRLSSTNDKMGSAYHLLRWGVIQMVEETFPKQQQKQDKADQKA